MPALRTETSRPRTDDGPIRVAFDVGPLHGHQTGIGRAVAEIAHHLQARDEVELHPYLISARATPTAGQTRLPLPGIAASHLWSRTSRLRADRWIGAVEVVHGTNYVAPPTRFPTVVSVYDCWFLAHPELAHPVVARAGRWLRRAVGRGAWVHCSSRSTADEAERLLQTERTRVIHLGPPGPLPEPAPPEGIDADRIEIVAVGTEERRKGYPDLIDAFGLLALRNQTAQLAIAGAHGDDSDRITDSIAALPVAVRSRVFRLGTISDANKAWLLRNARVLAYPSLDEGFGFPLLEANQAGLPIVARSVGSIPEVAGDSALLVPDGTDFAAGYADALHTAIVDDELRSRLIGAGEANLGRFSWDRCTDELIDLYRTAIGTTDGPIHTGEADAGVDTEQCETP